MRWPVPSATARSVGASITASIVAVAIAGAWAYDTRHDINKDNCERTVATREDNRAMWLYLVNKNPDPSSEEVVAFVAYLNERLPSLECVGSLPTPVEEH